MDDLEATASAHCSHLYKTKRDWLVYMTEMLLEMGNEIPSMPSERYAAYRKHKVPEKIYLEYDSEATQKALSKISAG
jgi:hypothetical protein